MLLLPLVRAACATTGPDVRPLGPVIPVPPVSTPDPENAGPTLLIRLDVGYVNKPGKSRHTADYLSDRTVIRWTSSGLVCQAASPCGALERNTLTAEALTALRALLAEDSDLLGQPRTFEPQLLPGRSWSGRSNIFDTFVSGQPDGSRVTVHAASTTSFDAPNWAPNPAVDRLNALVATLVDPSTLAGPAGLSDPTWTPYTPEKTAVFIRFREVEPIPPTPRSSTLPVIGMLPGYVPNPDINDLGWPFAGTPETFGSSFTPTPSADSSHLGTAYRCTFLPTVDAVMGIGRLPQSIGASIAAGDLASGLDWIGGTMRWSARSPTSGFDLAATTILPEEAGASCADLFRR
jgi:hypothetical protein